VNIARNNGRFFAPKLAILDKIGVKIDLPFDLSVMMYGHGPHFEIRFSLRQDTYVFRNRDFFADGGFECSFDPIPGK
jgi:hypothetical protein